MPSAEDIRGPQLNECKDRVLHAQQVFGVSESESVEGVNVCSLQAGRFE